MCMLTFQEMIIGKASGPSVVSSELIGVITEVVIQFMVMSELWMD